MTNTIMGIGSLHSFNSSLIGGNSYFYQGALFFNLKVLLYNCKPY